MISFEHAVHGLDIYTVSMLYALTVLGKEKRSWEADRRGGLMLRAPQSEEEKPPGEERDAVGS